MNYNRLLRTGILAFTLMLPTACSGGDDSAMPKEVATVEHPAFSPSGKYVLYVVANDKSKSIMLSFEIRSKNGDPVFRSTEMFDDRHMTYFLWDDSDRVWVYSGDIGTFFWEQDGSEWKKYIYVNSDVSAPSFLKEKRPCRHKK